MKALAIDVGGTAIKAAIVSSEGELSGFAEFPTPKDLTTGLVEIARGFSGYEVIGVSTAGLVDSAAGTVAFSSALEYGADAPVRAMLEAATHLPVHVENDVNCACVCEGMFGAGRDSADFVCLTYGTSIGGALFLNGGLYSGKNNLAGEIGHMVTHAFGRDCPCGQKGCYSEYASVSALVRQTSLLDESLTDGRAIMRNTDRFEVMGILDKWVDEVCVGLANVVHILNPPLVILGGGIMVEEQLVDKIKTRLPHFLMPGYRDVRVERAMKGNTAGLIGAAMLAIGEQAGL